MKFRSRFTYSFFLISIWLILATGCLPSSASTPTPTQEIAQTETPTSTGVPALPSATSDQSLSSTTIPASTSLEDLMEEVNNCELPCWWGITPGKTTAKEAETFLRSFGEDIVWQDFSDFGGVTSLAPTMDGFQVHIEYTLMDGVVEVLHVAINLVEDEGQSTRVVFGSSQYRDVMNRYLLPQVLSTYGEPQTILFKTFQQTPTWFPAHTLLHYPEKGILIEYISPNTQGDAIIKTCPQNGNFSLWLVSPNSDIDLNNMYFSDDIKSFLPLEDATNISPEDFYITFGDQHNELCLEAEESIWPLFPGG